MSAGICYRQIQVQQRVQEQGSQGEKNTVREISPEDRSGILGDRPGSGKLPVVMRVAPWHKGRKTDRKEGKRRNAKMR